MSLHEKIIQIPAKNITNIFGEFDVHIKKIERSLSVTVVARDDSVKIIGNEQNTQDAVELFTLLNELIVPNIHIENEKVMNVLSSEYGVCYLIALILSVIWNFTFNRKYTFKSATNVPIAMLKVFGFYCIFTPVSTIIGELVSRVTTWEFAEYIILGVTMLANMITEFLFCKYVVYKDSMNTLDEDEEELEEDLEEAEKDAKEEWKKAKKKARKQEKKKRRKAKRKAKRKDKSNLV